MTVQAVRFGSVCSGIEAASVAWHHLGWQAAWVSEIEAFPSAVLAHHWPDVPNLGDMLRLPAMVAAGEIEAPDILVGGTPCQAFSVAGKRGSLEDERGALTLAYVELANGIDKQRQANGDVPCIIVWENVPGVLNTKDNAFGCFLAALAGESEPLEPAGGRWTNAGAVFGPQRTIAWRVLDAQYFGVAQRRRRVFVVASAREGFNPCEVLFERDGLRRDTAPSREAGKDTAADAGAGAAFSSMQDPVGTLCARDIKGVGNQFFNEGKVIAQRSAGYRMVAFGEYANVNTASAMKARDYKDATDLAVAAIPILEAGARTGVSTTDPRAGIGIGHDGDPMFTLQAGKQHGVACAVTGDMAHTLKAEAFDGSEDGPGRGVPTIAHTVALRGRDGGATAELGGEIATALRASTGGGDKPHVLTMPLNTQIVTRGGAMGRSTGFGLGSETDLGFTLQAGHSHGVFTAPTIGFQSSQSGEPVIYDTTNVTSPQNGSNPKPGDPCYTLAQGQHPPLLAALAVRRLTPTECERLQGFPDDYTLVPHRNKTAADGPRYKALGNSMAVPVMRWIGNRINAKGENQ